jgi:hypothetical protein
MKKRPYLSAENALKILYEYHATSFKRILTAKTIFDFCDIEQSHMKGNTARMAFELMVTLTTIYKKYADDCKVEFNQEKMKSID